MVDVGNATNVVFNFFFMIDITQFYQRGYTDEPTVYPTCLVNLPKVTMTMKSHFGDSVYMYYMV